FDYLLDKDKEYIATFAFGYQTDTLDLEGKTELYSDVIPSEEDLIVAAGKLTGEIMQIPPSFSAKCVDGKRSYQLARKGKPVELPPKKVFISSIEILEKISHNEYAFKIKCKGGTYIRSIARDVAAECGTCATMTSLIRTASGVFRAEDSIKAEDFINAHDKEAFLIRPDEVVDFPKIFLDAIRAERLFNGLSDDFVYTDGTYRVYSPDGFYGVGEMKNAKLKVKAYLRDNG
ncbi:MAG: hypothetical protein J5903_01015, partial [Clostridia bacterium]|nr:hypothetical protein [Clostridia bacterium]